MTFTAEALMNEIERYASPEISYIDTITHIADKHEIEIEVLATIINRNKILKAKIYEDAERYKLVDKNEGFEFE